MKEFTDKIEELEKQVKRLKLSKNELMESIESKNELIAEILNHSDMAIVDTTLELRILNTFGSIDIVFDELKPKLTRGVDIMNIIYKATQSIRDKGSSDNDEDLDRKVNRFISSQKDEIQFKIIGRRNEEIFLLIWDVIKNINGLRHFFRIIPTNTIVEESKGHFKKQAQTQKNIFKQILNSINDGIVFIDLSNKIKIVNKSAKELLLTSSSKLMSRAELEGRFFHEIFPNEQNDLTNKRLDINNQVIITREPTIYKMQTLGRELIFNVLPWYDDESNVIGVLIVVSKEFHMNDKVAKSDDGILKQTLKNFVDQNKILKERVKELEYNHQWLMKKRNEDAQTIKYYHNTIKNLYSYLDNMPYPMSILKIPERKYEFVNKAFIKKSKLDKKDILAKTDKEVFGETIGQYFDDFIKSGLKENTIREFKHVQMHGRQTCIADASGNITYILRVYEK